MRCLHFSFTILNMYVHNYSSQIYFYIINNHIKHNLRRIYKQYHICGHLSLTSVIVLLERYWIKTNCECVYSLFDVRSKSYNMYILPRIHTLSNDSSLFTYAYKQLTIGSRFQNKIHHVRFLLLYSLCNVFSKEQMLTEKVVQQIYIGIHIKNMSTLTF